MIDSWLAPVDIALGLGSPIDEVLDAIAALGLAESRAHSRLEGVRVYSPAAVALVEQRIRSGLRRLAEQVAILAVGSLGDGF